MKVLVTGSSGYCGRVIARHLVNRGIRVVGLDVQPPGRDAGHPGLAFVQADVRSRGLLERIVAAHEPTHVIHLAFRIDPTHDPEADRVLNVDGSLNVGRACFAAPSVRQVVLMSSTSVYGAHRDNPEWIDEDHPLRSDGYPYADHKRRCEARFRAMARGTDKRLVILRPCTVAGPSTPRRGGVVRTIARSPLLPSVIGGDGRIQLVHEDDLAELVSCVLHDAEIAGTFNLCPDSYSTIEALGRTQGARCIPVHPAVLRLLLGLGWRLRLSSTSPAAAPLVAHGIVGSAARIRERYGYAFRFGTREAFLDAVARRVEAGTL